LGSSDAGDDAYSHIDHPDVLSGAYDMQVDKSNSIPDPVLFTQSSSLDPLLAIESIHHDDVCTSGESDVEKSDCELDGDPVLDDLFDLQVPLDTSHLRFDDDTDKRQDSCAYLEKRGILVEDRYNLTICVDCNACIKHDAIYGHRHARHSHLKLDFDRLGPKTSLINHLENLGAHCPRSLPPTLSSPLPVIPVIKAFRCAIPGCVDSKIFRTKKHFSAHCREQHPKVPRQHRLHTKPYAQRIGQFRGGVYYVEVIEPSLQEVHPKVEEILRHSTDLGIGVKGETYNALPNVRGKTEFLAQTKWDLILEDVNLSQLRLMVAPPNPTCDFIHIRLRDIVRQYYQDIAERLEVMLPCLVLRYLHSTNPKCVFFFSLCLA
jgi:hypothetical protein